VLAALNADRPDASRRRSPRSRRRWHCCAASGRHIASPRACWPAVPLRDGTAAGDLVVEGGGDPSFVTENALLVLSELERRGLRTVAGTLRIRGPFLFNWQPDGQGTAAHGRPRGPRRGDGLVGRVCGACRRGGLRASDRWDCAFSAGRDAGDDDDPHLVVTHRSAALVHVLKSLNCYSNNVFHVLSERIGGPQAVEDVARASLPPALQGAIAIDDAAGLGTTNRMSPRVVVSIIDTLANDLARQELTLADVLPIAGRDPGTLHDRLTGGAVVGKTGTIGSLTVSALAGRALTRRFGEITFAIIDRGIPVHDAQRRQDAFVRFILAEGEALPWMHGGVLATLAESDVEVAR
jgi:D-alanyl-D-alanine carboxypeptidase/D-alanyl-D-alanine-endopeptidase (penicillin-binding protein 4)